MIVNADLFDGSQKLPIYSLW